MEGNSGHRGRTAVNSGNSPQSGGTRNACLALRDAVREDFEAVKSLETICGLSVWTLDDYLRASREDGWIFHVAVDEKEVVGYILARLITRSGSKPGVSSGEGNQQKRLKSFSGDEYELYAIGVLPNLRRWGIGRELLKSAFKRESEGDPLSVFLEVRRNNAAAIRFYEDFGFQIVGSRPEYYRDPTDDAVLMEYRTR